MRRSKYNQAHLFIRKNIANTFTVDSASIPAGGSKFGSVLYQFSLNVAYRGSPPNNFDEYRIRGVKVRIRPRVTQYNENANSWAICNAKPQLYAFVDYTGDAVPDTLNGFLDHSNCVVLDSAKNHAWFVRPKCLQNVYFLTGSGYAQGKRNQWINIESPDVPHYGLYVGANIENNMATASPDNAKIVYDVDISYYLEFKVLRNGA